ncbi:FMN-dependent NADH-azoreductase [Sphingobium boeckii]|uniref:FMN dependent NADH:quinone oxidoreductase n=1 Tax=Sphingobium boeckii TaxID=1082345 RepID=A0A7W9AFU0_9SPHN|nr:NAD(P)H-dependent oxidoreductase [Sphingobium boeckii]MBB5684877.1 FMN-dependent NADH-azoreductase [Sphingobium boeckii]
MTKILFLKTSPRSDDSFSTKVGAALVAQIEAAQPGSTVVVRDLGATPPPHIDSDYVVGRTLPTEQRSPKQAKAVAIAEELIGELMAADTVVIASAMINFSLSSSLKSWFDHILMPGGTFIYVDGAPQGLATGKIAYIVEARGGVYSEGPMQAYDFQEPYLRAVLGFIGIADLRILLVEGIAYGPDAVEAAVAAAIGKIPGLLGGA